MLTRLLLEMAASLACLWVRRQERWILAKGAPFTAAQSADARALGLAFPERVRVLAVETIPPRLHPILRCLAAAFGMHLLGTVGMAVGHGIFIRSDHTGDRPLLVHELAHVRQYERLGFRGFLKQYLRECLTAGYPAGELEVEARGVALEICG